MRLVIDLQGAQGLSRHRGIGRYCLSLTRNLLKNRGKHEVVIVLSDRFPETIEPLRLALTQFVSPDQIKILHLLDHVRGADRDSDARRCAAELVREQFLCSLSPDFVLITSMFEGFEDNAVTSIGRLNSTLPTAVVLFDLIPLINREIYLRDPQSELYYERKISYLRRADQILSISESTRQEAIEFIGIPEKDVINISSAADEHFTTGSVDIKTRERIYQDYGLYRPFIMYTGGIDHRKNIEGLIRAYSKLSIGVREGHQLAIICSMQEADRTRLMALAFDCGLSAKDVILTGYIPEDDLLACYRMCKLFVFPSWHEGFGLPVLEAMKCGRAVLASNRSSLPEVVGIDEALFDPFDVDAMSLLISRVLEDDAVRTKLEQHSLSQAQIFNWTETARRTWSALEARHAHNEATQKAPPAEPKRRPRLAYFSPLPPEESGISDYSAELLPELTRHYQIDAIVNQEKVEGTAILANCSVRNIDWFRNNAHAFDRIIYHFGNSTFHAHMFDLLQEFPGVIVLHDFFLSGIISYLDLTGATPGSWSRALLNAHGWEAVAQRFCAVDSAEVVWAYPCNMQVLEDALGIIVHSNFSQKLAQQFYGANTDENWHLIPHLRRTTVIPDRLQSRKMLNIDDEDFVVCCFGILAPTKMNDRLVSAWLASPLSQDPRCRLVFVGENLQGPYGIELEKRVRDGQSARPIEITGRVDIAAFRRWLSVADVGVQLRTLSRGETSGTVLDCMNAGLATIVNANGSMAELPDDAVCLLPDDFSEAELIDALTKFYRDRQKRLDLGANARAQIVTHHVPRNCATAYVEAIESCYENSAKGTSALLRALHDEGGALQPDDWQTLCAAIAQNSLPRLRRRRLLVDVSELVRKDWKTGIQRVVWSILGQWLHNQPSDWFVEPVYAVRNKPGYRYARKFACRALDIPDDWCADEIVEPVSGDVFIGLDLDHIIIPQQKDLLQKWSQMGVSIRFVIYDLLPILHSEFFLPGARQQHDTWLRTISQFDGVICISHSVASDYKEWLDDIKPHRANPIAIDWFHLGGDLEKMSASSALPDDMQAALNRLEGNPTFLTVGTIEPRKAVDQVLAAVEMLWDKNIAVNLLIVGKLGWLMDDFVERLRHHARLNDRLFWFEAVSDEHLEAIYEACDCLIAASKGEGFGLPIVEAARHGLPVLARDIPVFREITGESAIYFEDSPDPAVIASALNEIIDRFTDNSPLPSINYITWAESANALFDRATGRKAPHYLWSADTIAPH